MRERIARITANYPWVVAACEGQLLGYVYATQFRERAAYRWAVEVAVYIAMTEHRRGLGRASTRPCFRFCANRCTLRQLRGSRCPTQPALAYTKALAFDQPVCCREWVTKTKSGWMLVGGS